MAGKFVHLHNHTEFSLLDGAQRLGQMIEQAKRLRMPALAITDHGVMYGAVAFYQKAREAGLKPIIGVEAYIAPGARTEKQGRGAGKPYYHLVLLAKNMTGYRNLVKLVSAAHLEGFHYKPRIDKELLVQYGQGLVVLSGCLGGEINQLLMRGQVEEATTVAEWYRDNTDYYLEIQRHHLPEQDKINPLLIELARNTGIPLVATNDVHYLYKEDQQAQEILVCIQTGKTLNDERRTMRYSHHHYLKSPEEMAEMFADIPEAITNTIKIAEKCDLIMEINRPHLPRYTVPPTQTPASYLTRLAREGLKERYPEIAPVLGEGRTTRKTTAELSEPAAAATSAAQELEQRLDRELQLIEKMGFADYFLVVWDFIRFAREQGIMVGPGRGSAAGSLVAYCLRITNIDPIRHHLLFERFLNPERISMPDIDVDFCIERRGEVIKYVTDKYGADHVCQIVTFGTLGAKSVIRDVARVMGRLVSDADRLAKLVPTGPNVALEDAMADGTELKKYYDAEPETKELLDLALKLEGLSRHASVHAAGVVISQEPLTNVVPLQRTSEGQVCTQYPMGDIEKLGLLKMDFLGLRNLTMIDRAMQIIKHARGVAIDLDRLPIDDAKAFKLLQSGDVVGVFQLDSSAGIRKLVKDLAPSSFEEIVAVIALYRPGPLGSGMVDEYIERKHNRRPILYEHPLLEPILKDSYGICVYQEQIMQIAQQLAGYSLGQADILRRAMGKKKPEEMAKQKETFLDGAARVGIRSDLSVRIFETMEKFAEYGFNKSHSAAYAVITYQTAYLKANYPVEYMAALISSVMSNPDKLQEYVGECNRLGIDILRPDINASGVEFSVEEGKIRFGLAAVRNVGEAAVRSMQEAREKRPFTSLYDFSSRVDLSTVNKRAIESLIKCGAFDDYGHRAQLLAAMEAALDRGNRHQKEVASGQTSLFSLMTETPVEQLAPPLPTDVAPWTLEQQLGVEKELLGIYLTGHPLQQIRKELQTFCSHTSSDLKETQPDTNVVVGGMITEVKRLTTKKNDSMAVFKLEDLAGTTEVIVFPKSYVRFAEFIAPDTRVLIRGKLQVRDDERQIALNHLYLLPEFTTFHVQLNEKASLQTILGLMDIFKSHMGTVPVMIHTHSGETVLVDDSRWVKAVGREGQLIKQLQRVPGVATTLFHEPRPGGSMRVDTPLEV